MAANDFTTNGDQPRTTDVPGVYPPAESVLLNTAYKKSGLTAADLAVATGLSVATIRLALSGLRYRDGEARVAAPPDHTLVKLASILRVHPEVLRAQGRGRAADLLAEANDTNGATATTADLDAQAVVAGRSALAKQILAVFSVEELRAEVDRRDRVDHDRLNREAEVEHAEDLATQQWPV